jgi:hypothetical protein
VFVDVIVPVVVKAPADVRAAYISAAAAKYPPEEVIAGDCQYAAAEVLAADVVEVGALFAAPVNVSICPHENPDGTVTDTFVAPADEVKYCQ